MRGGYTKSCKNYSIIFKGFRIADSCAKLRFARLAGTAAHCARFREAKSCTTRYCAKCWRKTSIDLYVIRSTVGLSLAKNFTLCLRPRYNHQTQEHFFFQLGNISLFLSPWTTLLNYSIRFWWATLLLLRRFFYLK